MRSTIIEVYYANLIDQRRTDRNPWLRPKCAPWKYFAAQDYAKFHACKEGMMNYINKLPAKSSDLAPIATSSYLQTWNGIFMDVNSGLMTESRGQLKCDSMERNLTLGWWHLNTVGLSTPHYIASEKEVASPGNTYWLALVDTMLKNGWLLQQKERFFSHLLMGLKSEYLFFHCRWFVPCNYFYFQYET